MLNFVNFRLFSAAGLRCGAALHGALPTGQPASGRAIGGQAESVDSARLAHRAPRALGPSGVHIAVQSTIQPPPMRRLRGRHQATAPGIQYSGQGLSCVVLSGRIRCAHPPPAERYIALRALCPSVAYRDTLVRVWRSLKPDRADIRRF